MNLQRFSCVRGFLPTLIGIALPLMNLAAQGGQPQMQEERRRGELTPITLAGGSRVEFATMPSQTLNGDAAYSVFLPPSYSREPSRTYPVVYFLHGLNNDHTSWTVSRYGDMPAKVEELIATGKIPEIIMIHPRGDSSFYCNAANGTHRYEDFITQELVSMAESRYRARKGRENRAIGGTSMGGFGSLKLAMKFPGQYAAAVGQSPIIFLGRNPLDVPPEMQSSRFFQFFANMMKSAFGDPLRQELWDANNPIQLARSGKLGNLKLWMDYGTEDRYIRSIRLDEGVKALDRTLTEAGVPHTFKEYPGEPHGWALVASHLAETLPFLCQAFK